MATVRPLIGRLSQFSALIAESKTVSAPGSALAASARSPLHSALSPSHHIYGVAVSTVPPSVRTVLHLAGHATRADYSRLLPRVKYQL